MYAAHISELVRAYERVCTATGTAAIALHSGSLKKRSAFDDQYWSLRPTPHFQHWVHLAEPDCAIFFVPGKKPVLAWPRVRDFWENPAPPESEDFLALFDVVRPASASHVKEHVPPRAAFIGEDQERAADWGLEGNMNPPALVLALDDLRTRKTAYEVACLAEANARAARGHLAVKKAFEAGGASELDLHLLYLRATEQDDPETPYKNIVALNEHAATLHHVSYVKRPSGAASESLLLDAGAGYRGYCSDITRTWVRGTGATAAAFLGLVERLDQMQQAMCQKVKRSEPYEALHDDANVQIADILRDVGVARGSTAEVVATGISRKFFPHGLGHSLGLQCHDVGCARIAPKPENPFLRNTTPVTPDQVFTIEPGIYFIAPLLEELRASPQASMIDWKLVDALAPFGGVRIEDDLVVLHDGPTTRNLTREVLP